MFENNQLTMPLAYILVLVMCLVSLVLLSAVRWLARNLCGKPKFGFHALFGFMLAMDLVWSLAEYTGHQTKFLTFAANAVWYVSFVWICYRWYEDCLQNLNALVMNRWVPRPVRLLPVFATWLMIGASWWTGQLVGVSEAGCYCRGPYLWAVYAVAFLYLVATIPVCISSLRRSQSRVTRGAAVSCLMATGTLMLSAYLQYATGFAFIFIGVIIILAIIDFGAQHMAMEMEAERDMRRKAAMASVSHNIRTPLNAIVGFSELLQGEVSENRRRELQDEIIASSLALTRMVNGALGVSGDEHVKPDPVPVASVCQGGADPVPVSAEKTAEPDSAASRKRRILVVDDVTLNRKVISALLKRLGQDDITHASDGDEALALLKTGPVRYDLVLTDLQMPKMDGDALVRAIRADARLAKLQVHVVTADVRAPVKCANVGFDSILIKPVTIAKLSKVLTEA